MSTVRWAVAGFGAGGRVFHAPLIQDADGIELTAVVSTNSVRADQARAMGLEVVEDLAALATQGIDGVTLTTPAATHVPLAHEALDLGLHVVVDKPFALTGDDAAALVEHADRVDRRLTVYQNRRWDGDFLTIAALVEEGRLGVIRRFTSRIERFRPDLPAWTTQATSAEGGGVLVDLGPHLIDQACVLFGPVASVFAELEQFGADRVSEDDIVVLLHHASGVRSTIVASLAAAAEGARFQVNGDVGGALIRGFDIQEEQLFAGGTPIILGENWGVEPRARDAEVIVGDEVSSLRLLAGRWTAFYPAVAEAVRSGGPVPVDPRDAVHVARIFDAARESSATGRVVPV